MGARLRAYAPLWKELFGEDTWIYQVVSEGLRLSFNYPPPLSRTPTWTEKPAMKAKEEALSKEVDTLLLKKATEIVWDINTPGFYSRLFLVPKPGNRWRPVIDLSRLNLHITTPHFRMETARNLRASIAPNDFAVSLDMTDAYLHVPIHPSARRYLRFAYQGIVYQFRALPFGLNLSPWVFTRIVDSVVAYARQDSDSPTSNYLDDLLLKNQLQDRLATDRDFLLNLLTDLGFLINMEKSDLTPSQDFIHLGMHFLTHENRVRLPDKRVLPLVECVEKILTNHWSSARMWLRLLGLLNAAADIVPHGRLFLRPLQIYLLSQWRPSSRDLEIKIERKKDVEPMLTRWLDTGWLQEGVPLSTPAPELSLVTDASVEGWGAHILPSWDEVRAYWKETQPQENSNILELRAVGLALKHWEDRCRGQQVLVLSDNTAVVAYIQNAGGTRSVSLCMLTFQLLSWCISKQIVLRARHIPGRLNVIADALSRKGQILHTEWTLCPEVFTWVKNLWETPMIDLFATRWNNRLPTFVSPVPDPQAWAVDALSISWEGLIGYAYPPSVILPKILPKIRESTSIVILIAPFRWDRVWTTDLLQLATHPPVPLPSKSKLLKQPRVDVFHSCPEKLALHAWRLSAQQSQEDISRMQQWRQSLQQGDPLH